MIAVGSGGPCGSDSARHVLNVPVPKIHQIPLQGDNASAWEVSGLQVSDERTGKYRCVLLCSGSCSVCYCLLVEGRFWA